jgi:hypothetical protein
MECDWVSKPRIELYGPQGELLAMKQSHIQAELNAVQLSTSGQYAVMAMDDDGIQYGEFELTFGYCGDANSSGAIDIDDIVFLISWVFAGGTDPFPIAIADVNCSGQGDIDDIVFLINYVFSGGPIPCSDCAM